MWRSTPTNSWAPRIKLKFSMIWDLKLIRESSATFTSYYSQYLLLKSSRGKIPSNKMLPFSDSNYRNDVLNCTCNSPVPGVLPSFEVKALALLAAPLQESVEAALCINSAKLGTDNLCCSPRVPVILALK